MYQFSYYCLMCRVVTNRPAMRDWSYPLHSSHHFFKFKLISEQLMNLFTFAKLRKTSLFFAIIFAVYPQIAFAQVTDVPSELTQSQDWLF